MEEQVIIQRISDETSKMLKRELKRNGMLKTFEKSAIDMTKDDIEHFNELVELINKGQLSAEKKVDAVFSVKFMKRALSSIQKLLTERDFTIFYSRYFQNQSIRNLAFQLNVDNKTITRAINKALTLMSIYLHTEVFLDEIIN